MEISNMRIFSPYLAVMLVAAPIITPAAPLAARTAPRPAYAFQATAFSTEGTTRSGTETQVGIVAADNTVLPLGTRIRVTLAGNYPGSFCVRERRGQGVGGR